ncbi:hypothetical protein DSO57_1019166 [Entomophthora muscae]|uniref:Uncharacterized protein n=1 Tax=Entomophthora muscae TaxID=34485 RepID=A0ACC2RVA6_9FUNG|nr:hypothetical protein DSO57_1019166 [Entomophthora muscae]
MTLHNKEDILYFLFSATFYTRSCQAKATVLVNTGAAGNFMNLALAQFLDLSLLPPQSLIAASKVLVLSHPLTNPLSYCTVLHIFVSKFSTIEDLLYPVIVGVGWWRCHLVHIDCLTNKLHFLLDGSLGSFLLLPLGWNLLRLACLLRQPQSLLLSLLLCQPSLIPSRKPLTLPCLLPSPHTLAIT